VTTSEKPANVREFDSCQGKLGAVSKHQGNSREDIMLENYL